MLSEPLTPPGRLSAAERAAWGELVEHWRPLGVLTQADVPLLEMIVRTWSTWQDAERVLADTGPTFTTERGYTGQRPEVAISLKNRQLLRQLLNEIGATPSSRSSVDMSPVAQGPSTLDLFLARNR
jgi:P27 family predicted phage terminase small subunit